MLQVPHCMVCICIVWSLNNLEMVVETNVTKLFRSLFVSIDLPFILV